MKPILEIQKISKKYKLRGQETPYLTFRDALMGKNKKQKADEFWALKDVSFDVYPGESIGIIGKNGAGKSTLLKILSKITPPTEGKIIARGRIASLLEVGTGFHAELTGMENIFLNGSILGLKKIEIKKKLDEIIDFAGVEKFIDTPLKHYSSGMQLRLAFAVAAHLEPEILMIDEVLAVGDAEFQKKSLGKMEDIAKQGRTVLFVSHNMPAVQNLCNRGVLLQEGNIREIGKTNKIVENYLKGDSDIKNHKKGILNDTLISLHEVDILEIKINAKSKKVNEIISLDDKIIFYIRYKQKVEDEMHLTIHLKDELGNVIFTNGSWKIEESNREKGEFEVFVEFPDNFFNWGNFFVDLFVVKNKKNVLYVEKDIIAFTIVNKQTEIGGYMGKEMGGIHPNFKWIKQRIK